MKAISLNNAYFPKKPFLITGMIVLITSLAWFVIGNKYTPPTPPKQVSVYARHDSIGEHIQKVFDSTSIHHHQLKYRLITESFYQERNWQPAWHSGETSSILLDSAMRVLANVYIYGLLPQFYDFSLLQHEIALAYSTEKSSQRDEKIALLDIHITEMLLHLMNHLRHGKMNSTDFDQVQKEAWLRTSAISLLCKAITQQTFSQILEDCQPSFWRYKQLQLALVSFVNRNSLDSSSVPIPDYKKDSLASYKAIRQALIQAGYFSDSSQRQPLNIPQALMNFQQANGLEADGKPGAKTRASLSRSNWDRFCQVAINLDRLRKENISDSAYLFLNIPAFQLYVYQRDSLVQTHRLIVGKPQTPTHPLSSQIQYIVIAPQWNVPYSIATREMLPSIKASIHYLAENNLMVFNQQGQMVNPSTIEWKELSTSNFPYSLRQEQGCDNALGNIMFYFPNSFSTFLHDTPTRKAFNQHNRALSHGCMRLENPVALAQYILSRQGLTDSLDTAMVENCQLHRQRKQIHLAHPFPIHVRYLTAGTQNQQLIFYPDVYQRDPESVKNFLAKE